MRANDTDVLVLVHNVYVSVEKIVDPLITVIDDDYINQRIKSYK